MIQAEVNEGGPPPAAPCDTPVEVISHIHMSDPPHPTPDEESAVSITKREFERMLTENLERLREEIRETQAKGVALKNVAKATWNATMADIEAKQHAAGEKLDEMVGSTGDAWEHLREGARRAWDELERAVRKARSEF